MGIKRIYHAMLRAAENVPDRIEWLKTWVSETIAIQKKTKIYHCIHWTENSRKILIAIGRGYMARRYLINGIVCIKQLQEFLP